MRNLEHWVDVPGWPDYAVSNCGRVWSKRRGRQIKTWITRGGYEQCNFMSHGRRKHFAVHRLVLTAFCGPPKGGQVACHNNGHKLDNSLPNLRWDTQLANQHDRRKHGTHSEGEKNGFSKLTEDEVFAIRSSSEPGTVLAKRFSTTATNISDIRNGKSWRHLL